jgi:hypothetical protein
LSTDVPEVRAASIIRDERSVDKSTLLQILTAIISKVLSLNEHFSPLTMEAARTSETSVENYFTLQYIPEDKSELHTGRRENLKSHIFIGKFCIYLK